MKLKSLKLKNFRSYQKEIKIEFEDITALIGRNDIGKSTILEALEIFFNNKTVKIDKKDLNINALDKVIEISCEFIDLQDEVIIDALAKTNLKEEYLLNSNGNLEIIKQFNIKGNTLKENIFIKANYPQNEELKDLILQNNTSLKKKAKPLDGYLDIDQRNNSELRKFIYGQTKNLILKEQNILLKNDSKNIYDSLSKEFPLFVLFQSDRASSDEDSEVQDPMKIAVKEAIDGVQDKLDAIMLEVQNRAKEIASKTLEKLQEFNKELAQELTPTFKEEPKWANIFKLSLETDQVPLNKRGSGVKRLILLSFFRAQAEKVSTEGEGRGVIYAIEEPETSQHPHHQKMLIDAFLEIVNNSDKHQVILTTHVPEIAKLIPIKNLRLVKFEEESKTVIFNEDRVYEEIILELGIHEKFENNSIDRLFCVEGPNDIECLSHLIEILKIPNREKLIFIPLGGGTLEQWVRNRYLQKLNLPETHLYDNDVSKYLESAKEVNLRTDGSKAFVTKRRELENYIPKDLLEKFFKISLPKINDTDDVPELIRERLAKKIKVGSKEKPLKISKIKQKINKNVAKMLTSDILNTSDSEGVTEIKSWFTS